MSIRYDFDMFSIIPKELQDKFSSDFADVGISKEAWSKQTALWRDPRVVQALLGADQAVKDLFLESGFGLNVYDSGAPAGYYPAYDEVARLHVIEKLTENMERFDLTGANFNGFDFEAFLSTLIEAQPWDEPNQGLDPQRKPEASDPFGPVGHVDRLKMTEAMDDHGFGDPAHSKPVYTPPKKRSLTMSPGLAVLAAAGLYIVMMFGSELLGMSGGQMVSSGNLNSGSLQTIERASE